MHIKSIGGAAMSALAVLTLASAAGAHNHLTVDTVSGAFGDRILIRAGYLATETSFSVSGGRLMYNGSVATYVVGEQLSQPGALNGAYFSQDILLTSDFFYATGRLNGGNFRWELASVTALSGAGAVGWGEFDQDGVFSSLASSDAGTRLGRSYDTLAGYHEHEQAAYFTAPGTYDVTFVAWDSNGRYADSAPLAVRFEVVPAPGAIAFLAVAGIGASRRRRS
jgi:hypothetical protein